MRRIWSISGAGIALFVAACSGEPAATGESNAARVAESGHGAANDAAANDSAPAAKLGLAADGLMLGGDMVAFGAAEESALARIGGALGEAAKRSENTECGAGPLALAQFPGGLTLFFQDRKFVGWDVDGRERGGFAAPDGLAIGATRAQLQSAGDLEMEASTIGAEFTFNRISGLLSGKDQAATVTNLWAGTTCIFR